MSREKIYPSDAHRQQAYRQRVQDKLAGMAPIARERRPKKLTKPQRLKTAVDDLESLTAEYEYWLEALPENLSDSEMAAQLQETVEQLQEAVSMLDAIDLPRGFGR